jgi:phosphoglycolate phosphatase-like HAD superfamily hydrolase
VLALDFDGVISNSAPEAFTVALRTWSRWRSGGSSDLGQESASLYERFLRIMPLGNRAEDYCVALLAMAAGIEPEDQAAYDAFHAAQDQARLKEFHREFYRVRRAWSDADPEGWRARMAPYPGIPEMLRRWSDRIELAIATSKDRGSVRRLLDAYGIGDLFGEERVLDKEAGERKRAHVLRLSEAIGLPVSEITLLDDKVNHLHDVAGLGAGGALAAWGYNGEREWREAERAGFPVCRLEDVEERLFG